MTKTPLSCQLRKVLVLGKLEQKLIQAQALSEFPLRPRCDRQHCLSWRRVTSPANFQWQETTVLSYTWALTKLYCTHTKIKFIIFVLISMCNHCESCFESGRILSNIAAMFTSFFKECSSAAWLDCSTAIENIAKANTCWQWNVITSNSELHARRKA